METVNKMPQTHTKHRHHRLLGLMTTLGLAITLSACAGYRSVPTNATVMETLSIMGDANHICQRADGGQRFVWSRQPLGQYIYGADVGADGRLINGVQSVMTSENFRKLDSGRWSANDVLCEFGPPAETERLGLGEKREVIWSYRYKEANHWNKLLHIYLGPNGDYVTRWHTGPDPLYEREYFFPNF